MSLPALFLYMNVMVLMLSRTILSGRSHSSTVGLLPRGTDVLPRWLSPLPSVTVAVTSNE